VPTGPIIVTGASGHLGSRIVHHLLETHGVEPGRIVAVTRTPSNAAALAAKGVDVRAGDFDDQSSLDRAFAGGGRLLLVSTNAMDRPLHRRDQHLAAVAAAVRAGVSHIAYTSLPGAARSTLALARDHEGTEQALAASGVPSTVLGNNWYFENLFYALPAALKSGRWHTAAGDGRIGYIAREDCARVAARVMVLDRPDPYYDVAGETALTTSDIAAIVRDVTGAALEVVQLTDTQLRDGLLAAGVPPPFADLLTEFDRVTREGELGVTSDTVRRLTGRDPETLRDYIGAHAQALTAA